MGKLKWVNREVKLLKAVRSQRDRLLKDSDWTQLEDADLTQDEKRAWKQYRKALRDLPKTVDLENVVWPTKPTKEVI